MVAMETYTDLLESKEEVEAELEQEKADHAMEAIKRKTAEQTARSLQGMVAELKDERDRLAQEIAKANEAMVEMKAKSVWAEMVDSQSGSMAASGNTRNKSRSAMDSSCAPGDRRMTKAEATLVMPKSARALIEMIPEGEVDIQQDGIRPYAVMPIVVLWQRNMVRKATAAAGFKEEHAPNVCDKCQSLFQRYTAKKHRDLFLKHAPQFCPLGENPERNIVDFDKVKTHLAPRVRDAEIKETVADAIKNCKFA